MVGSRSAPIGIPPQRQICGTAQYLPQFIGGSRLGAETHPDNLVSRQMLDQAEVDEPLVSVPLFARRNIIGTLQLIFEDFTIATGGSPEGVPASIQLVSV